MNVRRRTAVYPVLVGEVRAEADDTLALGVTRDALRGEDLLACGDGGRIERERIERFVGDDALLCFRFGNRFGVLLRL